MDFKYDRSKYDKKGKEAIDKAITIDKSGELFNIMTRVQRDGPASYSPLSLTLLLRIYECTGSIEKVEKAALLDYKNEQLYDPAQILAITRGYEDKLPQEHIDIYTALNAWGTPIYTSFEMDSIYSGFKVGLTKEQVMIYAKLNKEGKPIYNCEQMNSIRYGLGSELSEDKINIYAQLDENMVPKFNALEMKAMRFFITNANDKQIQQLKDSINEGLSFPQFNVFCQYNIPFEKMRVYRSLYSLGCDEKTVGYIADKEDLTYDELKKIKYILACAKTIKESDKIIANTAESLKPYNVVYSNLNNLDELYEDFAYNICDLYSKSMSPSPEVVESIRKCLDYGIDPEQICFLITSGYTKEEVKNVSKSLIDGADFNEIKEARKISKAVLSEKKEIYITSSRPFGKAYGRPSIDLEDLFK